MGVKVAALVDTTRTLAPLVSLVVVVVVVVAVVVHKRVPTKPQNSTKTTRRMMTVTT